MASLKAKNSLAPEGAEIDLANLAKEVQQLELLARRSEAKLRRIDADIRLRELVAKNRAEAANRNHESQATDEAAS